MDSVHTSGTRRRRAGIDRSVFRSKAFNAAIMTVGLNIIVRELRSHAPYTALGTASGIAIMAIIVHAQLSRESSAAIFWTLHPLHVALSALVTTGVYRHHEAGGLWSTILVGYIGSVGIATLSDCVIPFVGEMALNLPHRQIHLGFSEKWWLVNPLALTGIALAFCRPRTGIPHAFHVLLSTWASLFHMTMAIDAGFHPPAAIIMAAFLFLAVWLPCCTSDIVFPLLAAAMRGNQKDGQQI